MVNYSELDDTAQDLLREIGNIGTGNAVTALSSMVGHSFNVELPQVRIINYRERIQHYLGEFFVQQEHEHS